MLTLAILTFVFWSSFYFASYLDVVVHLKLPLNICKRQWGRQCIRECYLALCLLTAVEQFCDDNKCPSYWERQCIDFGECVRTSDTRDKNLTSWHWRHHTVWLLHCCVETSCCLVHQQASMNYVSYWPLALYHWFLGFTGDELCQVGMSWTSGHCSLCPQVGKQFDALLVDTAAPSSYPVFDTFEMDTTEVSWCPREDWFVAFTCEGWNCMITIPLVVKGRKFLYTAICISVDVLNCKWTYRAFNVGQVEKGISFWGVFFFPECTFLV